MDEKNFSRSPFDKTDEKEKVPRWSELEYPALEFIYSYLSIEDRLTMRLVCRSWSKEFESPSVWKSFVYNLQDDHCSKKHFLALRCAETFGESFRHVKIACSNAHVKDREYLSSQLKQFLQIVTSRCKLLLSVSFIEYDGFLGHNTEDILNLLRSQKHLKVIEFERCFFPNIKGCKIIETIARHSTSLKKLKLVGFILNSPPSPRINEFVLDAQQIIDFLMNLREIEMDYGELFENVINICSNMKSPLKGKSLKTIKLHFCGFYLRQGFYRGFYNQTLKSFKQHCPELKIDVVATGIEVEKFFELSVINNMPIRSLHFRIGGGIDISILAFIFILPKSIIHLERLRFEPLKTTKTIVQNLISILQIFQNLRVLDLKFLHPISGLEAVFNFLMERGAGFLKVVRVRMLRVKSEKDKDLVNMLEQEYVPKMKGIGVNFEFTYSFDVAAF